MFLRSEFRVVIRYDFRIETMFGSSYLRLFVGGRMSCLRYLCLFAHSGVQHIGLCYFFFLLRLVLPISLDCPFLVAPSVFSNVYLQQLRSPGDM